MWRGQFSGGFVCDAATCTFCCCDRALLDSTFCGGSVCCCDREFVRVCTICDAQATVDASTGDASIVIFYSIRMANRVVFFRACMAISSAIFFLWISSAISSFFEISYLCILGQILFFSRRHSSCGSQFARACFV